MLKILITSPIRNQGYCLQDYLSSLSKNEEYAKSKIGDLHIDYYFVTYNNLDNTARLLKEFVKERTGYVKELEIKEESTKEYKWHRWTEEQLKNLGNMRNDCLSQAEQYDYAFMVDGDVKLQKETLWKLIKESEREHVVCTLVLANWEGKPAPNYQRLLLNESKPGHIDKLTGFTPPSTELIKSLKYKEILEVKVIYMVWLIPSQYIKNRIASFTSPDGQMEFKWFSKYLRDKGIKQLIDFTYPGTHMEKSGDWILSIDISNHPPKVLVESQKYGFMKVIGG